MPELPEVETIVRQLRPHIRGKTIASLNVYDSKLRFSQHDKQLLAGARISSVFRNSKEIVFELLPHRQKEKTCFLCFHLRMTGRLIWESGQTKQRGAPPDPYLRARLMIGRGSLLFVDTRRFGTMRLVLSKPDLAKSGIDPLAVDFSARTLTELISNSRQPIKNWLLRQDRIHGIGNIYASEILFSAKIRPDRLMNTLSPEEVQGLYRAVRRVLQKAIENSGTTFSDFQQINGRAGRHGSYLRVYQRDGEKCRRCGAAIRRLVQSGRSSFFCGRCQN